MGLVIVLLIILAFVGSLWLGELIEERFDAWFAPKHQPRPELFDLETCSKCANPAITTFEGKPICAACTDELLDVILGRRAPRG